MSSSSRSRAPATRIRSPSPRLAEQLGFAAFFRSDHYLAMSGDGLPGPTDSWVTLGAIARETSTIRLGTLVTSATFRYPGPLAIAVAQVDDMSAGRVEFGLGSGWFEKEHQAYGIPFPPVRERFERLKEQLAIITGLWTTKPGETFDYAGEYYTIVGSPALPKPTQSPHPPIVIGGLGAKRTPRLAAEYAAEFNVPFAPIDWPRSNIGGWHEAVAARRQSRTTRWSTRAHSCSAPAATTARWPAAPQRSGATVDELRSNSPLVGTPAEIVDNLGAWQESAYSAYTRSCSTYPIWRTSNCWRARLCRNCFDEGLPQEEPASARSSSSRSLLRSSRSSVTNSSPPIMLPTTV